MKSLTSHTPYGGNSWPANIKIERNGDNMIVLTLNSPNQNIEFLNDFINSTTYPPSTEPKLDVEITQTDKYGFNFTVFRTGNPEDFIYKSVFGPFIMGKNYIEFSSTIPSRYVRGLGPRFNTTAAPKFKDYDTWTLNSKSSNVTQEFQPGTHPFYLGLEPNTSNAHGVFIQSSTPMQIGTVPAPGFAYRALMGAFKIYFFAGPTPVEVTKQYTDIIGRPYLPPYWAFGYHLCRTVPNIEEEQTFK